MSEKAYLTHWHNHDHVAAIKGLLAEKGYDMEKVDDEWVRNVLEIRGGVSPGESLYWVTSFVVRFFHLVLIYGASRNDYEEGRTNFSHYPENSKKQEKESKNKL